MKRTLFHIVLLVICFLVIASILGAVILADRRSEHDRVLCDALETGDTNFLQQYFASGGGVNGPIQFTRFERRNGPLLDMAIQNGQLATVNFLLSKGANPNLRDSETNTPLEWAIGESKNDVSHETQVDIFKRLLQAGANPRLNVSFAEGYTPLFQAAFLGKVEMVRMLLAIGVNVDATNREGLTALNFAANADVAGLLLAAGADRTAHAGGETPAESAVRFGHFSALTVLTNGMPQK